MPRPARCTQPPAATISAAPRVPSEPIPVRTTARFRLPHTAAAEANNGSTAGLQKLTGGPSSSAITALAVAARDPHVAAAGRDIDVAGTNLLAVDRLVRRPAARARQMLGQDGR